MGGLLPGSSYNNPIKYRGWHIYLSDYPVGPEFRWEVVHSEYDGPEDGRCTRVADVVEAMTFIDEYERYADESPKLV